MPTAAAARAAAIVRVRLGGTHQQPAVRIRLLDLNAIMPPRRRSATETSGTMMEELTAEGLDEEAKHQICLHAPLAGKVFNATDSSLIFHSVQLILE